MTIEYTTGASPAAEQVGWLKAGIKLALENFDQGLPDRARRQIESTLYALEPFDHPYTVDVILHAHESYPCLICRKERQEHPPFADSRAFGGFANRADLENGQEP